MKAVAEVSVVIPCYRCAETIGRAIDSVAAQTMPPTEVILVDDCSNDGQKTLNCLHALKGTHPNLPLKILTLSENKGPGSARNEGWLHSTQPYIAFLDADDSWHSQKLEIQYSWMCSHPEVVLCAHASLNLSKRSIPQSLGVLVASQIDMRALLWSNFLPCRSIMLKRNIVARFVEGKRQAEDYLLWLSIGFQEGKLWYLNLPLAYSYKADFGQDGLNGDLQASYKGMLDTYRLIYRNGFISTTKYSFLLVMTYLKHCRRRLLSRLRSKLVAL